MREYRIALLAALAGVALTACSVSRSTSGEEPGTSACTACHGFPPPPGANGAPATDHPAETNCFACHSTTVNDQNEIIPADQGGTHDDGTIDVTDPHGDPSWSQPATHGPAAVADIASCQACHGATFDAFSPSCNACHESAGWSASALTTNCSFCHGARDDATAQAGYVVADHPEWAAPPYPVYPSTTTVATDPSVGAHQVHLTGIAYRTAPIACSDCHGTLPTGVAHANGTVGFAWSDVATGHGAVVAAFNGTTCTTWCHDTTGTGGGTPSWTSTTNMSCGSCHALPPHADRGDCANCHPDSSAATHINGTVDVTHPAGYADPTVHGPEALAAITSCQACHGTTYDGAGAAPSCNACHTTQASWNANALTTNCTFCHGTKTKTSYPAGSSAVVAPPESVTGITATTDPNVGAHQAHLAGGTYSTPIACAQCHAVPTTLSHVNGITGLVFGALASQGNTPTYSFSPNYTCTNYCHGATLNGGLAQTPSWTAADLGTNSVERCAACHGSVDTAQNPDTLLAPSSGKHLSNHKTQRCYRCHGSVVARSTVSPANSDPTLVADKSLHVNGAKNVQFRDSSGNVLNGDTWNGTTCTTSCHGDTRTW